MTAPIIVLLFVLLLAAWGASSVAVAVAMLVQTFRKPVTLDE